MVEDGGVSIDARMSALGQKADVTLADCDVRFTPERGHWSATFDVRFVPKTEIAGLFELTKRPLLGAIIMPKGYATLGG